MDININNFMKNVINKLENYPIGMCGTSLAFITLSNCWAFVGIKFLKPLAIIFAIIAISLMFLRIILFPKIIWEELKNPVIGTFYPTIDMSCFLIAAYFINIFPNFSKALWLVCIIFHGVFFVLFCIFRIKDFSIKNMIPSWFVVLVGVVVGSASSANMGYKALPQYLFYFGFTFYIIVWPFMVYRIFKCEVIEENKLPTIGIMAAPASLCIVGYLTAFKNPNSIILIFLVVTSLFNLGLVYSYILMFIKKGFSPIYAALTFPLAISIFAMYKLSAYLNSVKSFGAIFFKVLGNIENFIGTYVIFYVIINFIKLFLKAINLTEEKDLKEHSGLLQETIIEESFSDNIIEEKLSQDKFAQ